MRRKIGASNWPGISPQAVSPLLSTPPQKYISPAEVMCKVLKKVGTGGGGGPAGEQPISRQSPGPGRPGHRRTTPRARAAPSPPAKPHHAGYHRRAPNQKRQNKGRVFPGKGPGMDAIVPVAAPPRNRQIPLLRPEMAVLRQGFPWSSEPTGAPEPGMARPGPVPPAHPAERTKSFPGL